MRIFPILSVAFAFLANPVQAACPSALTEGKICAAGADMAAQLASDMPVDLDNMRLIFAVGTIDGVMVVGKPAIGGALPDPAVAGGYLCTDDGARDFIDSGGKIEVLMNDQPFLTLSDCGDY